VSSAHFPGPLGIVPALPFRPTVPYSLQSADESFRTEAEALLGFAQDELAAVGARLRRGDAAQLLALEKALRAVSIARQFVQGSAT
jgi:hypothetical protein